METWDGEEELTALYDRPIGETLTSSPVIYIFSHFRNSSSFVRVSYSRVDNELQLLSPAVVPRQIFTPGVHSRRISQLWIGLWELMLRTTPCTWMASRPLSLKECRCLMLARMQGVNLGLGIGRLLQLRCGVWGGNRLISKLITVTRLYCSTGESVIRKYTYISWWC